MDRRRELGAKLLEEIGCHCICGRPDALQMPTDSDTVKAWDAAADPNATTGKLIFGLAALDRAFSYSLAEWSRASVAANPAHRYLSKLAKSGKGEEELPGHLRGKLRVERQKLANFLADSAAGNASSRLRGVLVARLVAAGVRPPGGDWRANGVVDHLRQLLLDMRGLRTAVRNGVSVDYCRGRIAEIQAELQGHGCHPPERKPAAV